MNIQIIGQEAENLKHLVQEIVAKNALTRTTVHASQELGENKASIYILDMENPGNPRWGLDTAKQIRKIGARSGIIVIAKDNALMGTALKERLEILDFVIKGDGMEKHLEDCLTDPRTRRKIYHVSNK